MVVADRATFTGVVGPLEKLLTLLPSELQVRTPSSQKLDIKRTPERKSTLSMVES